MSKQIYFKGSARQKMLRGMDKLARAVEATLGASGPSVIIQHRTDGLAPVYTRDGVTVARSIELSDRVEDLGARMLRDVAGAVSRQAGDGTTTAVVLARKIAAECMKSLAAGAEPVNLKKGIDLAVAAAGAELRRKAIIALDAALYRKTCQSSCKEEAETIDRLVQAVMAAGDNVAIEMGRGRGDELEILEGARWEQGHLSPYFVTDRDRELAELEAPYILLYDREIEDFMDLVPLLEEVNEQGRSLLVVAEGVSERALAPLLLNHVRKNFCAVAVKPPGFGDRRADCLQDLAVLTGGRAVLEACGDSLARVSLADLGQAQKAVVRGEETVVLGAKGKAEAAALRLKDLEAQAAVLRARKPGEGSATGNAHDLGELETRIARLKGKTAVYRVGGTTDLEIKERMVRIENAYNAIKAAMEEGVLPGGGIGLLGVRDCLDDLVAVQPDQYRGIDIVRQALAEPLRRIAANAGLNPDAVLAEVAVRDDANYGYDVLGRRYGNVVELGIVDPVKVTRLALESAAGIVGTLMTTEAVVIAEPLTAQMPSHREIADWAAATREDPRA